ncbi:transglycosylase SLT domain-containing protein [Noviherbaspirillum sp. UKPF54]|uniref:transglycosylase SLT domain-containing protein n=1 Tax=Noviherbaspirillum sp. UKPF54 TaxID=2601898 RepID=UPI0011B1C4F4|nr:transglycosylase SLT domain-containing protein [Noviherbaspirillum sp. UKPF54]QDZ27334.1 LysM peptidoglycan-binding domain-containing protein [Noviherbaspirillum sp. UKPF54]
MHLPKTKILPVAAFFLFGIPLTTLANDLSLPLYNWAQASALDKPYDPNDPIAQVLAMEEVDVWGRIRKGFGIPDLNNPLVDNQLQWYTSRPDYIQRTTTRASRYLFHVVQELEKRGMPTELALLPFIESAFNPQAYSTAKAAGMWQFIPSTGRDFNLKQSAFKDERRDVLASTDAALTYLQKLYDMFGDWQLALAAYNWGEGSVQRAVNKNRAAGLPTDFNSLSPLMPVETRNYVPKLQAVKNIIAMPAQYGITLPKVENQPYFVTIGKTRDIDIKVAAQLAELSIDEFKALNPQFNRPVITGSSDTQILLPQSNAAKFKANLAKWGRALSSWTAHKVTSARERIETIASKFHTTPQVIREVNNIPPNMRLKAGSTVLVPKAEGTPEKDIAPEIADNATIAVEPDVPDTRRIYVKVGKRDTLASIAKRNQVSVAQIKTWNSLKHDKVSSGQTLQLHVPYKASKNGSYHVARGSAPHRKIAPPVRKSKATAATSKTHKKHRG